MPVTEDGADAARFQLRGPTGIGKRALVFRGRDIGMVDGERLVAHFPVDGVGWLIVTDCNCPFEETLNIILLAKEGEMLEQQVLGGIYVPGIVDNVRKDGPNQFSLTFPDTTVEHSITVLFHSSGLFGIKKRWLSISQQGRR